MDGEAAEKERLEPTITVKISIKMKELKEKSSPQRSPFSMKVIHFGDHYQLNRMLWARMLWACSIWKSLFKTVTVTFTSRSLGWLLGTTNWRWTHRRRICSQGAMMTVLPLKRLTSMLKIRTLGNGRGKQDCCTPIHTKNHPVDL